MDKFENYIGMILKGLSISKAHKKELEEELRDHLTTARNELLEAGYSEEQAASEAIHRFGEVDEIRKKFRRIFTPYKLVKDWIDGNRILRESMQWAFTIIGALFLSILIRSYVFASTEVKQVSMQNTLFDGQRLIESKIGYYFYTPKSGDIVIINREAHKGFVNKFIDNAKEIVEGFYKEEDGQKRLIKRVVGVPGDVIDIKDGKVYINGECYNESYVKGITLPNGMTFPVKVPENQYFVMGDNRESSLDSRMIGFVDISTIEGKAVLRLWPLDKLGGIYK